ncbi:Myb SANT-like DNA-binding domain containing 4 with coiled-coils [Chamberlinius hualienensis]
MAAAFVEIEMGKRGERKERKKRCSNWKMDEERVLVQSVELRKNIVLAKHDKSVTNEKKKKLWEEIAEEVNQVGGLDRSITECKTKWYQIVASQKHRIGEYHQEYQEHGYMPSQGSMDHCWSNQIPSDVSQRETPNLTPYNSSVDEPRLPMARDSTPPSEHIRPHPASTSNYHHSPVEEQRLQIAQQRLDIEKQRLDVEKQRLNVEKQILATLEDIRAKMPTFPSFYYPNGLGTSRNISMMPGFSPGGHKQWHGTGD